MIKGNELLYLQEDLYLTYTEVSMRTAENRPTTKLVPTYIDLYHMSHATDPYLLKAFGTSWTQTNGRIPSNGPMTRREI